MRIGRLAGALALGLALAACQPNLRSHGWIPPEREIATVAVGQDTRDSVLQKLGRPSAEGLLAPEAWFYVQSRFRHLAFLAPEEIEREVLVVSFAPDGTVRNLERFGLEAGRVVALSRRVTDSPFPDQTFLRQLLTNLGRIDPTQFLPGDE
jgi:outer membrane protein assembly factor BamE (lipoprotein component of BamABCDE complex)